jgi:hypothetical protein
MTKVKTEFCLIVQEDVVNQIQNLELEVKSLTKDSQLVNRVS